MMATRTGPVAELFDIDSSFPSIPTRLEPIRRRGLRSLAFGPQSYYPAANLARDRDARATDAGRRGRAIPADPTGQREQGATTNGERPERPRGDRGPRVRGRVHPD